jgi:hypothetical protein
MKKLLKVNAALLCIINSDQWTMHGGHRILELGWYFLGLILLAQAVCEKEGE